jgi:hypothetical protein
MRKALSLAALRTCACLGVLALLVAAEAGCPPGRFQSCDNDDQCPKIDGGKLICYNRRCVECHYDGDCPAGSVCSGSNTCESLGGAPKEEEVDAGPPPTTLEECAKRCKGNPSCGDDCRERFKK